MRGEENAFAVGLGVANRTGILSDSVQKMLQGV